MKAKISPELRKILNNESARKQLIRGLSERGEAVVEIDGKREYFVTANKDTQTATMPNEPTSQS